MKVWFTSDTHFGAERTLNLSKRPFDNVSEMDRKLIHNWNKVVGVHDIVYHLGDFGDYNYARYLRGQINLIQGNYERVSERDLKPYEYLFYSIIKDKVHTIELEGYTIRMAHEPHYIKEFPIDEFNINLFGHIHRLCMIKKYGINVGSDAHFFTPISLEEILFYQNAIFNYYDNDVFN